MREDARSHHGRVRLRRRRRDPRLGLRGLGGLGPADYQRETGDAALAGGAGLELDGVDEAAFRATCIRLRDVDSFIDRTNATVKALEERASKASDERSHIHEQMEASSVITAALQREVAAIVAVVGEEAVKREERDQALDEALVRTSVCTPSTRAVAMATLVDTAAALDLNKDDAAELKRQKEIAEELKKRQRAVAVSYTHLTLPTKRIV